MPDVFTKAKRSAVMARIRSTENRDTELRLVKIFREHNITGWRRKYPLFGKPDFVFPQKKLVVFVDGCFWHGCPKHGRRPTSNTSYWDSKIARNQTRDRVVNLTLRHQGWRILRIWEHELTIKNLNRLLTKLHAKLAQHVKRKKSKALHDIISKS